MSEPEKPFLPRWARYLLLPGLFCPVLVVAFVNVVQFAHDEARCPYVHGETRSLGAAVSVREDRRNCLWDLEDRRFNVIRADREHTIGNRRFRADAFAQGQYEWSAELSAQDEVQLRIKNAGHEDATFREGTPAERERKQ